MKKVKPNLRKMFSFHTIILVIFVIVVSTLHKHNTEGKLQRLHKHHHNHNYKHRNELGVAAANDEAGDDAENHAAAHHSPHHRQHQHNHHHHHHHEELRQQQQEQQHYDAATPSLEFTTSSSSSSSSSAAISSDNEFLIKQQQEQPPLINKDEIYYKTKDVLQTTATSSASVSASASPSTTSNPSLSIHLMKQNIHNPTASTGNITFSHAETLREHTHRNSHNNRLTSTPLILPEGKNGEDRDADGDSGVIDDIATMYSEGLENKKLNSNWKSASRAAADYDDEDTQIDGQSKRHANRNHNAKKPEFDREHQRPPQNYEDYYSDAEEDEMDDEGDGEGDYNDDEGDNDGISYDDDNNFSDRSYARITRSKLDDDYIDDEPYRNGINELSMQRDAAPGVLTEQKYMEVGNEKAVQQARERYIQEQKRPRTPHELATEHWHRMIQATKCRKPLPRVIPVSNNTSKRYEPYATILHRCGDDTGCCGSTASVCTVKRHEIVMVYVFSYDFNYRKEIEALPMQNHTECHCVNRGSLLHDSMPRDKRSGGSSGYLHHFQRQQRKKQQQEEYHQPESSESFAAQQQLHHQTQLQNMLDCHCPRHFNVFEEDVERHVHLPQPHSVFIRKCRCDCLVNNQTCLRFKHGDEGFSLEDRKCILERNCKPPVCLYGDYNLRVGRCPSYRSHLLQTT